MNIFSFFHYFNDFINKNSVKTFGNSVLTCNQPTKTLRTKIRVILQEFYLKKYKK